MMKKRKKILKKFIRKQKKHLEGANFMKKTITDRGTEIIQFEKDGQLIGEILDPWDMKIFINY